LKEERKMYPAGYWERFIEKS